MNINFLPSVSALQTRKLDNNKTVIRNNGLTMIHLYVLRLL